MGTDQTPAMKAADVVVTERPSPARRTKKVAVVQTLTDRLRNLTEEQLVDGIILSEVLGKPVSLRGGKRR